MTETIERADWPGRWRSLGLLAVAAIGIVVGSALLVDAATTVTHRFGVFGTVFGMTVLALLVSVEELARELPAALRGRPDISVGNVVGLCWRSSCSTPARWLRCGRYRSPATCCGCTCRCA